MTFCSTRSTNFVVVVVVAVVCKEYKFKYMQLNFVLGSFESDTQPVCIRCLRPRQHRHSSHQQSLGITNVSLYYDLKYSCIQMLLVGDKKH